MIEKKIPCCINQDQFSGSVLTLHTHLQSLFVMLKNKRQNKPKRKTIFKKGISSLYIHLLLPLTKKKCIEVF